MKLNPNDYSPDVVALNPELFNVQAAKPQAKQKRPDTELESRFLHYWQLLGGPELLRDYTGWTQRKLELDFYHESSKTAIEINGGIGKKSGHTNWHGVHRDYDKLNACNVAGITLFCLGTDHMSKDRLAVEISAILRFITNRERRATA